MFRFRSSLDYSIREEERSVEELQFPAAIALLFPVTRVNGKWRWRRP